MTKLETIQLRNLCDKIDDYIKDDLAWKVDFEKRVSPLVKERADRLIIQEWWRTALHVTAVIVGVIISLATLVQLVIEPLINSLRR